MAKKTYDKYVVQELKAPFTAEMAERYAKFAKRILWIDDKVVPGSFQMNCSWYMRPPAHVTPEANAHTHDADEIIGFFGSNPLDPYELGGEIEFWLEDEQHFVRSSSLIFVPAGMKHCPLLIRRVDRPIFHFSTVTKGQYKYIPEEKKG